MRTSALAQFSIVLADLGPAFEIGINARSGAMFWRTKTDANLAAIVSGMPNCMRSIQRTDTNFGSKTTWRGYINENSSVSWP